MEESTLTKQERRDMRREERAAESSSMRRSNVVRRLGIWGGVFLVVGLMLYGLAQLGAQPPTAVTGTLVTPVSDADWSKGTVGAPVTLVEYGDFQCPACGAYHPLVDRLMKEHGAKIRFVYRHYPLNQIHPHADSAARAAEAAGAQGKFWEMYDLIFTNQDSWSRLSRTAADAIFFGYAKELGLNEDRFKADHDSDAIHEKVDAHLADGTSSGVNSTPTFFINGQKIVNPQSYEALVALIQNAPAASPTPTP